MVPKIKSFTHRAIHECNIHSLHGFLMAPNIICPFREPFIHTEMHFYCATLSNYELDKVDKNQH